MNTGMIVTTVSTFTIPCGNNLTVIPCAFTAYSGPPIPNDFYDDRHNPKAWAQWFREFLEELLGAGQAVLREARQRHPLLKRIERLCRLPPKREWKMKLWKQSFAGVV